MRTRSTHLRPTGFMQEFDAALVEQQDSRDHVLGHASSGGPADFLWMKIEPEAIGHDAGT
jgi:hypothetical protein